jgi:hypothetical protein
MALIEDIFKGNLATGLAVGVGVILLGPTVIQAVGGILRPAAKTLIRAVWSSTAKPWARSEKWRPISSRKREPNWTRRRGRIALVPERPFGERSRVRYVALGCALRC